MRTERRSIPLSDTTSRVASCNAGDLTVFTDSLHAVDINSILAKPVLTRLTKLNMRFDDIPIDIWTRWVSLRKNDEMSYVASSHRTLMAYGAFDGGAQSASFAGKSMISVVSMLFYAVVTLSSCIGASIDESLRVTSDETLSGGRCIGAKVTVRLAFTFCFS